MADDLPELLTMTKRELFAAMALHGIRASGAGLGDYMRAEYVSDAVADADELLAQLAKEKTP